jgi:peptidylprolyl isomerase
MGPGGEVRGTAGSSQTEEQMLRAEEGDRVSIVYSCRLDDGTVYDFEENRDPLEFTIGEGETIPALEHGVVGMEPGERRSITVPASAVTGVSLSMVAERLHVRELPAEVSGVSRALDIGPGAEGDVAEVLVPAVAGAKYSLAGRDLVFDIRLVGIIEKKD